MFKAIYKFFDKLEDGIRGSLSRVPVIYALIGGTAHVLFWRGVWHLADDYNLSSEWSMIIGALVLLGSGLLVASFIGDSIILSGIKHEKKVTEKTETEVKEETGMIENIHTHITGLEKQIQELKEVILSSKK